MAIGWPDASASFAAMKTLRRKTGSPKRSRAPKPARTRTPSVADLQRQVVTLSRQLNQAREQQTASSEVLQTISSSSGDLAQVFQAILARGVRLCEASYGAMWLKEGDGFRNAAFHGALPPAYKQLWRSARVGRTALWAALLNPESRFR
jgi:hypothetical protein